jgi:hypothetical protein
MSHNELQNPADWFLLAQSLARGISQVKTGEDDAVSAQVVETCAAAFAAGFSRGRWGKVEIAGVPADLGAGVLLHLLAWSGVAREQSRDLHNLAEGALATYFATLGASAGKRVRQGEDLLPAVSSLLPAAGKSNGARTNGSLPAKDGELLEFIRTIVPNEPATPSGGGK